MRVKKFINFSTVWQNYNGNLDLAYNLYSAFKLSYSKILDYYIRKFTYIKFYNLFISDTYGENDKRNKLINLIKKNIHNNKKIRIISKNLSINLLNVEDVITAIKVILDKNIKPGNYNVINNKNFKIYALFQKIKRVKKFKNLIKFGNDRFKTEKIYYFKTLPRWKPKNSGLNNLIKFILGQS